MIDELPVSARVVIAAACEWERADAVGNPWDEFEARRRLKAAVIAWRGRGEAGEPMAPILRVMTDEQG